MEQSVWDRVREGFLIQHTGEGAKKGSGVVGSSGPRGKEGGIQGQFVFLGVAWC